MLFVNLKCWSKALRQDFDNITPCKFLSLSLNCWSNWVPSSLKRCFNRTRNNGFVVSLVCLFVVSLSVILIQRHLSFTDHIRESMTPQTQAGLLSAGAFAKISASDVVIVLAFVVCRGTRIRSSERNESFLFRDTCSWPALLPLRRLPGCFAKVRPHMRKNAHHKSYRAAYWCRARTGFRSYITRHATCRSWHQHSFSHVRTRQPVPCGPVGRILSHSLSSGFEAGGTFWLGRILGPLADPCHSIYLRPREQRCTAVLPSSSFCIPLVAKSRQSSTWISQAAQHSAPNFWACEQQANPVPSAQELVGLNMGLAWDGIECAAKCTAHNPTRRKKRQKTEHCGVVQD